MHDLRARFTVILGLALLPLFVLSLWNSIDAFTASNASQQILLEKTTIITAQRVKNEILSAKSMLLTLGQNFNQDSCNEIIDSFLMSRPKFKIIQIKGSNPELVCATTSEWQHQTPLKDKVDPKVTFADHFSVGIFEAGPKVSQNINIKQEETMVQLAVGNYDDHAIKNFIIASYHITAISEMLNNDVLSNTAMSLVRIQPKENLEPFSSAIVCNKNKECNFESSSIVIDDQLRLTSRTPRNAYLTWSLQNFSQSIFIPLFTLLFAIAAIYYAMEHLVLKHVRYLNRSALSFAQDIYTEKFEVRRDAPKQILALNNTLNFMAHEIKIRETKLMNSAPGKDNLLREIHHRVNNNLQLIISLINIEERRATDNGVLIATEEMRNRIYSIALAHRTISMSPDIRYVNSDVLIKQLIEDWACSYFAREKDINLQTVVDTCMISADKVIPIALFVIESIAYLMKYDPPEGSLIQIKFAEKNSQVDLSISCKQVCSSQERIVMDSTRRNLILGFIRQLSADFTLESTDGICLNIKFVL